MGIKLKKTATALAISLITITILSPAYSHAASGISDIDNELEKLKQQSNSAISEQEKAEKKKKEAVYYKQKQETYLKSIMKQIENVSNELATVSYNIETTEENLRFTKKELEAAEERIDAREDVLASRVRLMYTDGTISYLDVLLSSTSFIDFLQRMDSLKMIVDQDQNLLVEHKKDKQLVVEKKQQLDRQYAEHKRLYVEKKAHKTELASKEQEKQKLILGYEKEIETQSELSDRQDQMLVEIALKRSALVQEKNTLKEEQAARAAKAKAAAEEAERREKLQKVSSSSTKSSSSSSSNGSGVLGMPIQGATISSNFGPRVHPITGELGKMHNGTDFAAPQGTSIYAAEDGVVIMAEWYGGYGNTVIVDHGDGLWTLYPHIRENGIQVKEGESVSRGKKIAEVGSTGNSTGPHLHFEVRVNGTPQNPLSYL